MRFIILGLCLSLLMSASCLAGTSPELKQRVAERVSSELPDLLKLYRELHQKPELSFMEVETARRIAREWREAGYEVTEKVGGHGIVALLRNGPGPTLMLRCDLDGLPVKELTGVDYASSHQMKDEDGNLVPTMHACGHDIHMTSLVGTARILASLKDQWQGTLMLVGQPAEERGGGARAMLADGLFKRFPVPDHAVALHVSPATPVGTINYAEGFAMANVDSVDITVFGVGGHGAYPHTTKDPVVLASQIVLALQTIVSREIAPSEPAVITVGSIHGGTKHNIIPDEVKLQLTVRSYSDEVREKLLRGIERIARGQGLAAGLPEDKLPRVEVQDEYTPAVYNNPELTRRLRGVFEDWLGQGTAIARPPQMGGEDFGRYGRTEHKVPICLFWLGAVSKESVRQAITQGKTLPSLHSGFFVPDAEPALQAGITATTGAALDLLAKP